MRKIFLIIAAVLACFFVEQILGWFFRPWLIPNLLLLTIVFFNLARGTRFSLVAAVTAGLLQDSLDPGGFGINSFTFLCAAYLTSFLKIYLYQSGSLGSRLLILLVVIIATDHLLFFLHLMVSTISYGFMVRYVLLPDLVLTSLAAPYVFGRLKICVLKYFG